MGESIKGELNRGKYNISLPAALHLYVTSSFSLTSGAPVYVPPLYAQGTSTALSALRFGANSVCVTVDFTDAPALVM